MLITAHPGVITALWEDAAKPSLGGRGDVAARIIDQIVKTGWAPSNTVEALLSALGCRMATLYVTPADLGIHQRDVFSRPARGTAFGSPQTAAADLAEFLIRLERLGLDVDPAPLMTALLPSIRKLRLLTQAELAVLWFAKQRHRQPAVTLAAKDVIRPNGWGCPDETVILPTGYIAEAWFGPASGQIRVDDTDPHEDQVLRLVVTKPKRARLRAAA